ncbi:LCP family protein [Ruminococcus sp.]|uniref:LCP family protein n=1 Tax=Ruminococcus sp. TaxID=41978 RepID=UPI0025E70A7A|nr:LCP family protein [Ruminococcus sp.]
MADNKRQNGRNNNDNYDNYNNNYYNNNNEYDPNAQQDYYEQEYQRQLDEFQRMQGGGQSGNDLHFEQYDDYYDEGYAEDYQDHPQYDQNRQGSYNSSKRSQQRQQSSGQNRQTRQPQKNRSTQNRNSRNRDLQFGSNNTARNGQNANRSNTKSNINSKGKKKMEKKRHPIRTFFKVLIIIILVLFILANVLLWRYISMVNTVEGGERTVTNASMQSANVRNILVIGSDTRSASERGRTDSMILLSINSKTKEITMTSFMRDMYVEIKGKDADGNDIDTWDKMNAAYVYGGAELLMDTIEYNFDIAVDDYVYIDFYSFVDIVDAIGGIEIKISDEEAEGMKPPMAEQNKILGNKKGTDYLDQGGTLLLNGNQALAYARLRYVGNADFERTERQRTVITKIIEKVKSSSPLTIDKFAKASMSNLTTNMSKTELYALAYKALFSMNYEINSLRIPADGDYSYGDHNGQSTLDVDFENCKTLLRETIYGN